MELTISKKEKNNVSATKKIETIDSVQEKNLVNKDEDIENNNNKSFVISCGSGCAMTYNVKAIEDLEKSIKDPQNKSVVEHLEVRKNELENALEKIENFE